MISTEEHATYLRGTLQVQVECALRALWQILLMSLFQPSNVINDRDRPRILLFAKQSTETEKFAWLEGRAGTYKRVTSLSEVDLSEWDVLVTQDAHAQVAIDQYGFLHRAQWSRVPNHLHIFRVFGPAAPPSAGKSFFEFNLYDANDGDDAWVNADSALKWDGGIPGHTLRRIDGLPESIQDLVKADLVPTVESRLKQHGIRVIGDRLEPAILKFRPFLAGPGDLFIAASYERPGGAVVWLVPGDSSDTEAWFDAALVEWHVKDRSKFPSVRTWQTDPEWDTRAERAARQTLDALEVEHAKVVSAYEAEREAARQALENAHVAGDSGPKSLLSGQDDPLQDAARVALEGLGFDVEDMDAVWDPRERREDFRIRDAADPEWLVIADATGVAKGAPGAKITTVLGYVTKYVVEERPDKVPAMWVIVNRLFHRDPLTRGAIYRPDEVASLIAHDGLALDTAALYVLAEGIAPGSDQAASCRAWLRSARGQITVLDAKTWLESPS